MRERGEWYNKEHWYSICSKHREYEQDCDLCGTGEWRSVLGTKVSSIIYLIAPRLWRKWTNYFKGL